MDCTVWQKALIHFAFFVVFAQVPTFCLWISLLRGPSNEDTNEDTLLKSDGEFESGQRSPDRKRRQREGKNSISNKRPRHNGHSASALEKKIQSSESSIQKLKVHAEKKTCPKDLRYNVRVNIAPDDDFKSDISRIRRDAE